MSEFSKRVLFWAPRALSIAFVLFVSLFAMDVFDEHRGFWPTAEALTLHLIPSFVLIAVLVLAWKWEWIGAAMYGAAGAAYILWVTAMSRPVSPATRITWALTIAGPALLIAALFLANWLRHGQLHHR